MTTATPDHTEFGPEDSLIVTCDCYSFDHSMRFSLFHEDDCKQAEEMCITVILDEGPFFTRLKKGLKYIFKSEYATCTEIVIRRKSAKMIRDIMQRYIDRAPEVS